MKKTNKIIWHKDYVEIIYKNQSILVDSEDYELIKDHFWAVDCKGYPVCYQEHKRIRLYWLLGFAKEHCDHINGNKLDNRRINLRHFQHEYQNMGNQRPRKNNKTGYQGVQLYPNGRYLARIGFRRKRINIGYFATAEEAARARDNVAKKLLGDYAYLNFPDE